MKGGEKVKVKRTLTIEKEVYDRVEEYADKNGISVSGAFSVLAMQKLDEIDALKQAHEMQELFDKMASLMDNPDQLQAFTAIQTLASK
jgi:hypothetical protein